MDIVITLPVELCAEILEGRKTVEVRKNYPKKFNCLKDRVYVIMKGTNKIVLSFTVSAFERYDSPLMLWHEYCYKIRVPYAWFKQYATGTNALYVWKIETVSAYSPHPLAKNYLGITHNPQSFIYVSQA